MGLHCEVLRIDINGVPKILGTPLNVTGVRWTIYCSVVELHYVSLILVYLINWHSSLYDDLNMIKEDAALFSQLYFNRSSGAQKTIISHMFLTSAEVLLIVHMHHLVIHHDLKIVNNCNFLHVADALSPQTVIHC